MKWVKIKKFFVGEPLTNQMMAHQRIPKWKALAVLSSDALSSVAYATEEILIPLAAFSAAALTWSIPIAIAIATLLTILTISYRQTIDSYPSGGGAYIVAKENLRTYAGLVAGASLLTDYILTVAVSTAAGVENIGSAFPFIHEHRVLVGIIVFVDYGDEFAGRSRVCNCFCFSDLHFYFFVLANDWCGVLALLYRTGGAPGACCDRNGRSGSSVFNPSVFFFWVFGPDRD